MGGSSSPRHARQYRVSGQTGSRKMPGQSQSVKSGNCDGYFSYCVNYGNPSIFNSANNLPNNIASTSWQNSNPSSTLNKPLRQGIIIEFVVIGGVGGGPNEVGSNNGHFTSWDAFSKQTYANPRPTTSVVHNGESATIFTDWSHYTGNTYSTSASQTYVDRDSRMTNNNFPFFFAPNPSFAGNKPEPKMAVSAGGGGWGAAGGSFYAASQNIAGGAGGPAIKTNGNTVTFSAGNTTSRVFGSVVS